EHRLLRAQMNPHFMFNALNSIQAFISENNTMQAEIFLSKFARLMRYYLDSSSKSFVSLDEEIAGLKLNIEMEQLRMNNSFSFDIEVDESIETTEYDVPPMLAQPFIENAIKHGLRTKKEPGLLSVSFALVDQQSMRCIVQDNGIGRAASKVFSGKMPKHESKGIGITQKRLAIIWDSKFQDDFLKISDLENDNGEADGTRVEFIFPYKN
ncbi:MAG: histidine kinase, partial [Bacteroidales bacterium]|nr:histidine kinase [Bacteroidales bacterium]